MYKLIETIAVYHGKPIFINAHLDRLERAMTVLQIKNYHYDRKKILTDICSLASEKHQIAIKAEIDSDTIRFSERKIPYTSEMYLRGFDITFGDLIRDETSKLTYCKTSQRVLLNAEHKKAQERGFQEVIFQNSQGNITEGSLSNLFYVTKGKIYTPNVSSGLLDGTLRRFLLSSFPEIKEIVTTKEDLFRAEELFLTNSLLGIMPVRSLQEKRYLTGGKGTMLSEFYKNLLETLA